MQVVDEITRRPIPARHGVRAIIRHIPGQIVEGFIGQRDLLVTMLAYSKGGLQKYYGVWDFLKDSLVFSNKRGMYISTVDLPEEIYIEEVYTRGQGNFPYRFEKHYEAINSFDLFAGRQEVLDKDTDYQISRHLKYSFGLEFETSQGYVPERLCFRDGLIPLRDGSISGVEYSTVVLEGNDGISLLKQQLDTLREFTGFNKECSLHIHMGGFPLESDKLYRLYYICKRMEGYISTLVPPSTFHTSEYKANGKDYCGLLKSYRNFDQMYESLVGRRFFGDFAQPHPNDIRREAKWRIPTRYFWVNFINALCYNVNKTIEFRLLRPTYNFKKITLWLYIFNALMQFAEKCDDMNTYDHASLEGIIKMIYPGSLGLALCGGLQRLRVLVANQYANGDRIGQDMSSEDILFRNDLGF